MTMAGSVAWYAIHFSEGDRFFGALPCLAVFVYLKNTLPEAILLIRLFFMIYSHR